MNILKRSALIGSFLLLLPLLGGCARPYDYTAHISESRYDVFRAETDEFSVTVNFVSREYPYADDGIACPRTRLCEISLVPAGDLRADFEVYLDTENGEWGGETSFRSVRGDYAYSESADFSPEGTLTLRVVWGSETREIAALSVRTEKTLSPEDALSCALAAEKETVDRLTGENGFGGELRIRLLKRDKVYYYVGIVGADGTRVALLLDGETGEVLAKRAS